MVMLAVNDYYFAWMLKGKITQKWKSVIIYSLQWKRHTQQGTCQNLTSVLCLFLW